MKFILVSVGMSVLLAAACGKNTQPSQLKHNIKEPVRKLSKPWLWANDSEEEYLKWGNPSDPTALGGESKKFLPANHEMTIRLQKWVDELDAKVRAQDPEGTRAVPKPIIHVQITTEANAFVTAIPVCFDNVSIRYEGSKNAGSRAGANHIAFINNGTVIGGVVESHETPSTSLECRHSRLSQRDLEERVSYINATHIDCQVRSKNLGAQKFEVIANDKCVVTGALENTAGAAVFGMFATSRHVTYFSGLLALEGMGEAETVAILAHELGHYYRTHVSTGNADYQFLYDASSHNPDVRPVSKTGTESLHSAALDSLRSYHSHSSRLSDLRENIPHDKLVPIANSEFHPMALPIVAGLVGAYAKSGIGECAEAEQKKPLIASSGLLGLFFVPLAPLNDVALKNYTQWEGLAKGCLSKIDLANSNLSPKSVTAMNAVTSGWKLAREASKPILTTGTMLEWAQKISAKLAVSYVGFEAHPATPFNNQALVAASNNVQEAVKKSIETATAMSAQKLGFYTGEQEADELSAEWIAALGVDLNATGNSQMALMKKFAPKEKFEACKAKRDSGWVAADGEIEFTAWNELLLDPHPDSCFRAKDADLEIKAHGYTVPEAGSRQLATASEWKVLTDSINQHQQSSQQNSGGSVMPTGIQAIKPKIGCRFE